MNILETFRSIVNNDELSDEEKFATLFKLSQILVVIHIDYLVDNYNITVEEALAELYNETDSMYEETDDERLLS